MIGEKSTCTACSREFTRIKGDEEICAVCADPDGYAEFLQGMSKEARLRERAQKRRDR